MAFQVCFIDHPQAQLVAKIVELGVGWVMRAPDRVDVVLLHQDKILLKKVQRYGAAGNGMAVMVINSPEQNGFAIDRDIPIQKLYLPKIPTLCRILC